MEDIMADDNNMDGLDDEGTGAAPTKKGGAKSGILGLLKWILIAVAAIIVIVTVVFITIRITSKNGPSGTDNFTMAPEYTSKRETYDWYTSLDQINTNTDETPSASVRVQVALGYKKDDKAASTEITNRRVEITDTLRRFFSEQTASDLRPQNEEVLRQNIKDLLNDTILSDSRIRDVRFTALDVISQY